jgi:hypothetical protein
MAAAAPSDHTCWDDLVELFTSNGLPAPPIPGPLRPSLRLTQDWCWATRDIDPFQMYMFDEAFADEILAGSVQDYAAVSHSGHGANSYGLNLHLVFSQLAVLMQTAWGGIYTDNVRAAADTARLWSRIEGFVERKPVRVEGRLLIMYSSLRGTSACGWVDPPGQPGDARTFVRTYSTTLDSTLDVAERLWSEDSQLPQA